jgi:hypothetical protein
LKAYKADLKRLSSKPAVAGGSYKLGQAGCCLSAEDLEARMKENKKLKELAAEARPGACSAEEDFSVCPRGWNDSMRCEALNAVASKLKELGCKALADKTVKVGKDVAARYCHARGAMMGYLARAATPLSELAGEGGGDGAQGENEKTATKAEIRTAAAKFLDRARKEGAAGIDLTNDKNAKAVEVLGTLKWSDAELSKMLRVPAEAEFGQSYAELPGLSRGFKFTLVYPEENRRKVPPDATTPGERPDSLTTASDPRLCESKRKPSRRAHDGFSPKPKTQIPKTWSLITTPLRPYYTLLQLVISL